MFYPCLSHILRSKEFSGITWMKVFLTFFQVLIKQYRHLHILSSFLIYGTTLTEPMHSLQHNSSSDIRSRMLMSVLRSATSSNHPSSISPSKNGNNM